MTHIGIERRRSERITSEEEHRLLLDVSIPVEVLDISVSGIQIASAKELAVGDRSELRATLGQRSVTIVIEIKRVTIETEPTRHGLRYRAGAVFGPMSVEQRVTLEQMLGTEPS
jgi:hypothetical protein